MGAGNDLVGGLGDGGGAGVVEQAKTLVHPRRGTFDEGQGADDLDRLAFARDVEVLQGALGLGAPQPVGRDFDGSE